jgi:hypothetical protein
MGTFIMQLASKIQGFIFSFAEQTLPADFYIPD